MIWFVISIKNRIGLVGWSGRAVMANAKTPEITRLIHANFWLVISFAFAQPRLEVLNTRFAGEWKYLRKSRRGGSLIMSRSPAPADRVRRSKHDVVLNIDSAAAVFLAAPPFQKFLEELPLSFFIELCWRARPFRGGTSNLRLRCVSLNQLLLRRQISRRP